MFASQFWRLVNRFSSLLFFCSLLEQFPLFPGPVGDFPQNKDRYRRRKIVCAKKKSVLEISLLIFIFHDEFSIHDSHTHPSKPWFWDTVRKRSLTRFSRSLTIALEQVPPVWGGGKFSQSRVRLSEKILVGVSDTYTHMHTWKQKWEGEWARFWCPVKKDLGFRGGCLLRLLSSLQGSVLRVKTWSNSRLLLSEEKINNQEG